jgi:hypothetical protein
MDITGVFEVLEAIEEIGARPGDRLVIGGGEIPYALVRRLTRGQAGRIIAKSKPVTRHLLPSGRPRPSHLHRLK